MGASALVIGQRVVEPHVRYRGGRHSTRRARVRNWWTPVDLVHFEASTQKLAEQYDTYKPFPDLGRTANRRWRKISRTSRDCRVV